MAEFKPGRADYSITKDTPHHYMSYIDWPKPSRWQRIKWCISDRKAKQ